MDFDVFADYYQIQVFDPAVGVDALADAIDDEALEKMIAASENAASLQTLEATTVHVSAEVYDTKPELADAYHVVDTDILTTGNLHVNGPSDSVDDDHVIELPAGRWRLRYSISADISPLYSIMLWPVSEPADTVVVKSNGV